MKAFPNIAILILALILMFLALVGTCLGIYFTATFQWLESSITWTTITIILWIIIIIRGTKDLIDQIREIFST